MSPPVSVFAVLLNEHCDPHTHTRLLQEKGLGNGAQGQLGPQVGGLGERAVRQMPISEAPHTCEEAPRRS